MTQEKDETRPAQTQSTEKPQVQTETPPPKPEKPPEPQNITFKVEKEPDKKPLIHFEKRTSEKKESK
jgi:hypothetical protein